MNTFIQKKHLLAEVRKGDFTHPGGREAVDYVMSKVDITDKKLALDIGSGLGGTVDIMSKQVPTAGIDRDINAIQYSREKYGQHPFLLGDVMDIDQVASESYDLFTIFSAFYAFSDQKAACTELAKKALPESDLLVFDYSSQGVFEENLFYDDDSPFRPIDLNDLTNIFSPWKILQVYDLTEMFHASYSDILTSMHEQKEILCHKHGQFAYDKVYEPFQNLVKHLEAGTLGGCLIHAQI